jgi:hypothetical protein
MNLKSQLQIALQESGYQTWLASVDKLAAIGFEDNSIMGFACIFESPQELLQGWRDVETALLNTHALSFQKAGDKTWNVYSVFLCAEKATDVQTREVKWIEENLERTRKIAACSITDRESLTTALLPLLPLQFQPVLDSEEFDVGQRLQKRILDIAPSVGTIALDDKVSANEIVRLLET